MTKINEIPIFTLGDISNRLDELSTEKNEAKKRKTLWFRGQSNHTWSLIPTIYRDVEAILNEENLQDYQLKIINEFINRKRHYLYKFQPAPNLEPSSMPLENQKYLWLSIMQHYSYQTCLLDFSEKLIPGLLFALDKYIKKDTTFSKSLSCLWVLFPMEMINTRKSMVFNNREKIRWQNRKRRNKKGKRTGLFGDFFESYNGDTIPSIWQIAYKNEFLDISFPMIFPVNSDRIKAQSGTFINFPVDIQLDRYKNDKEVESKEKKIKKIESELKKFALDNDPKADEFLEKWVIMDPDRLIFEITQMGYSMSDLMPGLDLY